MERAFIYFIPDGKLSQTGRNGLKETIAACGLDATLPEGALTQAMVNSGPFWNSSGLLFSAARPGAGDPAAPKYVADKQHWIKTPTHAVGYWIDNPPAPTDLSRSPMIPGYAWTDDAGNAWRIPLARTAKGGTEFPQILGLDEAGAMIRKPKERYASLCAFAQEHFERLSGLFDTGKDDYTMNWERHFRVAAEALAVNYHVGPYELTALGCVDEVGVGAICALLCDVPGLMQMLEAKAEAEKKTNSAETGDG